MGGAARQRGLLGLPAPRASRACLYVVGAMPAAAQMDQRATALVLVRLVELPMLGHARVSTDGERGGREVPAEAHVEGDVGVVGVHVQAQVLVGLVLDHERVVPREAALGLRGVEQLREREEDLALELADHGLHADVVDDDAVVVHAVRPADGQAGRVEVVQLLEEQVAELVVEDGKAVDGGAVALDLDAQQRADRRVVAHLQLGHRVEQRRVDPPAPPRRRVEELRVLAARTVGRDDLRGAAVGGGVVEELQRERRERQKRDPDAHGNRRWRGDGGRSRRQLPTLVNGGRKHGGLARRALCALLCSIFRILMPTY